MGLLNDLSLERELNELDGLVWVHPDMERRTSYDRDLFTDLSNYLLAMGKQGVIVPWLHERRVKGWIRSAPSGVWSVVDSSEFLTPSRLFVPLAAQAGKPVESLSLGFYGKYCGSCVASLAERTVREYVGPVPAVDPEGLQVAPILARRGVILYAFSHECLDGTSSVVFSNVYK